MIKFNVRVSKIANHYFFIQNLSEWHSRNKRKSNHYWIQQYGPLLDVEKSALQTFKKMRRLFPSTRSIFDLAFFSTSSPWKRLKEQLSEKEIKQLKNILNIFSPRFHSIYFTQKHRHLLWRDKLINILHKPSPAATILSILNHLYATRVSCPTVTIYLLLSSPIEVGGGANIDDRSLGLEISALPLKAIDHVQAILWHEIIHLCFERQQFIPLLIRSFGETSPLVHHYSELLASSLFPNGLLGQRFFRCGSSAKLSPGLSNEAQDQLLNVVNQTVVSNGTFNIFFLKKIKHLP